MKLMKELQVIHEGAMKDAIMDIIDKAVKAVDLQGLNYTAAVKKIARKVHELDSSEVVAGCSQEELADLIKSQFEEEDLDALNEAEEDPAEEETNEKVIGKADEFKVVLNLDTEMVDILDGEDSVRLTMPKVVWDQLKRQ